MQGSLFDWTPPCRMIVFPMSRRVGRIRDVAMKMLDKPTDRAASSTGARSPTPCCGNWTRLASRNQIGVSVLGSSGKRFRLK